VVIPTHDRARLVPRAIRSALAQTVADLEVLVVDDASSDDTPAAVAAIRDPRLRLLRRARQGGPAAARNDGLRDARGRWVAFLDSDDEWLPDKLARQLARAAALAPAPQVVYCQAYLQDGLTGERRLLRRVAREGDVLDSLLGELWLSSPTLYLADREALRAVGGFDEGLRLVEDYDLWLRMARAGHRFAVVDEPLAVKHEGPGPFLSADVAARPGAIAALDARWGPVVAARLGPAAYARWRERRLGGHHYARLQQVRLAARAGRRADAWRQCAAMARDLPRSAPYLVRGLGYALLGWRLYQALAAGRARRSGPPPGATAGPAPPGQPAA
jgi:hypothetical protein